MEEVIIAILNHGGIFGYFLIMGVGLVFGGILMRLGL